MKLSTDTEIMDYLCSSDAKDILNEALRSKSKRVFESDSLATFMGYPVKVKIEFDCRGENYTPKVVALSNKSGDVRHATLHSETYFNLKNKHGYTKI